MKERLCFTVRGDEGELTISYSTRDLKFLGGPLLPAGERFVIALGVFDNFTTSKGQDTEAWTSRTRLEVLNAARDLLAAIAKDQTLLGYDYQYGLSSQGKSKNTGGMSVTFAGRRWIIDARQPGQIYLLMHDGSFHDLRAGQPIVTDEGVVKVYRRRNKIDWQKKLLTLIEHLRTWESDVVQIRHHYTHDAT